MCVMIIACVPKSLCDRKISVMKSDVFSDKPYFYLFALSLVLYYYCYELVEVSNRVRLFFFIGIIALLPMLLEVLPLFLERLAGLVVVALYCFSFSRGIFLEAPQAAAYNPYQNYIEYKLHPRPSTGKQRLEQSKHFFRDERR